MNDAIITTIISSALLLIGTIITVVSTSNKNRIIAEQEQKLLKAEIKDLKERVDEHNNYAIEIPLIKKDISYIKEQLNNGRSA